jgi:hypothetical protein
MGGGGDGIQQGILHFYIFHGDKLVKCLMFFPNFYLKCSVITQTIIYTMLQYPMDHIDSIKQFIAIFQLYHGDQF